MIARRSDRGTREPVPGVTFRTLNHGARTLMTEFRVARGARVPPHAHPHEQAGYLVSGRLRLVVAGEPWELEPGDSWCIPGGVEHAAEGVEDAVAVEVFSPVREEYLGDP